MIGILCIAYPADRYKGTYTADKASFGANFYTYQYQATRDITLNTSAIDATIDDLGEKVSRYAGAAFIVAGLLIMIYFSKAIVDLKLEKEQIAKPIAIAPAETVFDYTPQAPKAEEQPEAPTEATVESETADKRT